MSRVKQQQAQNQQKVFSRRLAILGGLKAAMVLEQWPAPWPIAAQSIVNVALYPVLTLLFGRLQRALWNE